MDVYSYSRKKGTSYWIGQWLDEEGKRCTKYLGTGDVLIKYKRLTQEARAQRGTLWIFYEGQRMNIHLNLKFCNRDGRVYGPYPYWYGYTYTNGVQKEHYFGRRFPPGYEIIEGDAPNTESGYEEAPIDGFLAFLIEAETE